MNIHNVNPLCFFLLLLSYSFLIYPSLKIPFHIGIDELKFHLKLKSFHKLKKEKNAKNIINFTT